MCGTNLGNGAKISTHTLTWSVTDKRTKQARYKHISTHTLTWSVTGEALKHIIVPKISTHTLTWSVTLATQGQHGGSKFQLTRSRGA